MKFKPKYVELVKEVGSHAIDCFVSELDKFCDEHIPLKPNSAKIDISLLRFLANVVENSYKKKNTIDEKMDKKKVVVDEYFRMKQRMGVNLTNDDRKAIEELIEDLHNTGAIKRVSSFKYFLKKLKQMLLK